MKDIKAGEELTIDYAMEETFRFAFDCLCSAKTCRGKLTPEDWKLPELQEKNNKYFSPYVKAKMTGKQRTAPHSSTNRVVLYYYVTL